MRTFLITTLLISVCLLQGTAQSIVKGTVQDKKDRPVTGANISLENSYDGTTSGADGTFSFTTMETDSMTVLITATGFAPWRQTILPQGDSIRLAIILEKATNKLETVRSEEHTSELKSLMRISYAVFCSKKKT